MWNLFKTFLMILMAMLASGLVARSAADKIMKDDLTWNRDGKAKREKLKHASPFLYGVLKMEGPVAIISFVMMFVCVWKMLVVRM